MPAYIWAILINETSFVSNMQIYTCPISFNPLTRNLSPIPTNPAVKEHVCPRRYGTGILSQAFAFRLRFVVVDPLHEQKRASIGSKVATENKLTFFASFYEFLSFQFPCF